MPNLNIADALYVGSGAASAAYLGSTQVWTSGGGGSGALVDAVGATSYEADSAGSLIIARPAGVTSGDYLLLFHTWSYSGTAPSAPGSGFTQLVQDTTQGADATSPNFRISTQWADGSEPSSYTIPGCSNGDNAVILAAFRNVDPTDPIALSPVFAKTSNSTSQSVPTRTIPEDDVLWLAFFGSQDYNTSENTAWGTPSGMTMVHQENGVFNNCFIAMEQRDTGSTGARAFTLQTGASESAARVGSLALRSTL